MKKKHINHLLIYKPSVGGFNPLKNICQLGSLFPIYGKIEKMFQTTNQ